MHIMQCTNKSRLSEDLHNNKAKILHLSYAKYECSFLTRLIPTLITEVFIGRVVGSLTYDGVFVHLSGNIGLVAVFIPDLRLNQSDDRTVLHEISGMQKTKCVLQCFLTRFYKLWTIHNNFLWKTIYLTCCRFDFFVVLLLSGLTLPVYMYRSSFSSSFSECIFNTSAVILYILSLFS